MNYFKQLAKPITIISILVLKKYTSLLLIESFQQINAFICEELNQLEDLGLKQIINSNCTLAIEKQQIPMDDCILKYGQAEDKQPK